MESTRTPLAHVSLDTHDLDASVAFLRVLLDQDPFLQRSGYARFVTTTPALVLGLNAVPGPVAPGGPLNHMGIAFPEAAALEDLRGRLETAGLRYEEEVDVVCCYGRLSRLWVSDPASAVRWELFVPHEELVEAAAGQTSACKC